MKERKMTEWFGKNCKYLNAKWEDNELTGGPNYKDEEPVLVFCNHVDNKSPYEGNCNPRYCPLKNTSDSGQKGRTK